MNIDFDGAKEILSHSEKSPDNPEFKKFQCSPRNLELTWRRCMDNYVSANSLAFKNSQGERKLTRQPKENETWAEQCVGCEIGKRIRKRFSES